MTFDHIATVPASHPIPDELARALTLLDQLDAEIDGLRVKLTPVLADGERAAKLLGEELSPAVSAPMERSLSHLCGRVGRTIDCVRAIVEDARL